MPPSATAVDPPLLCDQSTVSGFASSGVLQGIDVGTAPLTSVATMVRSSDAIGVTDGGPRTGGARLPDLRPRAS